ncbi:MAG: peptidase C39 family protein [Nocardioides sp.]
MPPSRRRAALALLPLLLVAPLTGPGLEAGAATGPARAADRPVAWTAWDTSAELATGQARGTTTTGDQIALAVPAPTNLTVGRTRYEAGRWRSPWVADGFAFSELIASWDATTSKRSFVDVEVRGRDAAGERSSWDTLARWATGDRGVQRTTYSGQGDDLAAVSVDTWKAPGAGLTRWQVRVTLARRAGTTAPVAVDSLGAMTSRLPSAAGPTSTPGPASGITLDVPAYSQMTHRGHFPQWGGGGEAWCSPTSTSMVLGYYGALPPATSYPWVPSGHGDPWVDAAARATYDHGYDGTGNWPFNTAYAASRAGNAFVTRLRSLTEAEQFIAAGIPLVASVAFKSGELSGAPISSSAGHVLVVVGFTTAGDVVVNDPAAATNATVRRTYSRAQFERVWLNASGGVVYVVHDAAHPLPASAGNW